MTGSSARLQVSPDWRFEALLFKRAMQDGGKVDLFHFPGVTAGMDMSLDIVGRVFGRERAAWAAGRAEYEAHEDSSWDPFGANE